MANPHPIVIGIDPGSLRTGFGIVRQEGSRLVHIESGTIHLTSEGSLDQKLRKIQKELTQVIEHHKPSMAAFETIFYAKNVKSALTLAHARGVAICTAANSGIPVFEYSPLAVKEACVGYGKATKDQLRQMVCRLLNLASRGVSGLDESDALAVGICHLHSHEIRRKISKLDSVHVY